MALILGIGPDSRVAGYGVAIVAAAMKDIPVFECAAPSVKQAVIGKGSADKAQMQKWCRLY